MDLLVQIGWYSLIIGCIITLIGLFGVDIGDHIGVETFTMSSAFVFFGGSSLVMSYLTDSVGVDLIISIISTLVLSAMVHFLFVLPFRRTMSSTLASKKTQIGGIAQVLTTIPSNGYGEIQMEDKMFRDGQMAKSFDNTEIKQSTRVVVIDIRDHVFYVSPLNLSDLDNLK